MQHDRPILGVIRTRAVTIIALMATVASLAACSSAVMHKDAVARGTPYGPVSDARNIGTAKALGPSIVGFASWYKRGPRLERTCTGAQLSDDALAAASPTLRPGTEARVTLLNDERSVMVRIDDCMPRGRRVIDLSVAAARELGLLQRGVALVRVTPIAWR